MEQVGRGGHASNLHIAILVLTFELVWRWVHPGFFVTELEVAFHSAGRVLGTLAIIPMRERHDQSRTLQPLDLTGGDELVNNTLGVVGEITELSLPHYEGIG